ncbi:Site-specific recombinase XerD [Algoriella xinjiangensis]|uniref:Site-specific recombinase XerD n=1 Tax=Algoriella xinjiangensis TaxID=684065 RepID=A0A1I4YVM4_9FLAO|nr:site-specific integrase [Algoriella xinjiangensis]SFN42064.1 Site-specific recombinase XerD [Algoriella xinjiangensis]
MSNTTLKVVIGNKLLSDGKVGIYLRISKNRKKKEFHLGKRCFKDNFQNGAVTKKEKDYKVLNHLINLKLNEAYDIITSFELKGINFSLEDFEKAFRRIEPVSIDVYQFLDEYENELKVSKRLGTARTIKDLHRTLKKFHIDVLQFEKITPGFLEKFEVFMRARGNTDGGIAVRMRELRSIVNTAIRREILEEQYYPFKKYKISKLKSSGNKRALSEDEYIKFKGANLTERPDLIEAYDYFMFSFYARGMNFIDMMKLKWTDINEDRFYYRRSKTKKDFSIKITPQLKIIIDKYRYREDDSIYVFPILLKDGLTDEQIAYRKQKVITRCNEKLKSIGELVGIKQTITTYVARHTYATIMKNRGAKTEIISESMGHSSINVTMSYLKDFDNQTLDVGNEIISDL